MVESIDGPSKQAVENARLVLNEVPTAMQEDIEPLCKFSVALHIGADQYGNPFTDEQKALLRKSRDALLRDLRTKYPDESITNISDALIVLHSLYYQ